MSFLNWVRYLVDVRLGRREMSEALYCVSLRRLFIHSNSKIVINSAHGLERTVCSCSLVLPVSLDGIHSVHVSRPYYFQLQCACSFWKLVLSIANPLAIKWSQCFKLCYGRFGASLNGVPMQGIRGKATANLMARGTHRGVLPWICRWTFRKLFL